ncbi:MAG: hypothetical protein ACI90V_009636 [Bacillariaceae sp.]|jgi:hypothetical protein
MASKMRSALRILCQHGEQALKSQKVTTQGSQSFNNHISKPSREVWRRPLISKRIANDIRKVSIIDGSYGTFNTTTGEGWDKNWDLILHSHRYEVNRFGGMRPSKKTARQRNRGDRANKLEANLESAGDTIDQYYTEREESKIEEKGFEARVKRMTRGSAPGGGK